MTTGVTRFLTAITRLPCQNAADGLRAVDKGMPLVDQMLADHAAYRAKLTEAGANVITLPALPAFPDGHFVEDTALCLPEAVIFMSPGVPSRFGEVNEMRSNIAHLFPATHQILPPAYIEGGDILFTGQEILVGVSQRTNAEGIAALTRIVSCWGYDVRTVQTPPDVLHFKTDCSLLDDNVILSTERLASSGCFSGYDLILTCEGEDAAANAIRFNDLVIMSAGFPATRLRLKAAGYNVSEVNNSECAKIDGGMSCLSLRVA